MSERRRRGIIDLLLDRMANRPRLLLREEREAGAGEAREAAAEAERPARAEESPGLSLSSPPAPAPPAAPPPETPAAEAPPARARRARRSARRRGEDDEILNYLIAAAAWGRVYERPSLAGELGEAVDQMLVGGSGDAKRMFEMLASARSEDEKDDLTRAFLRGLADAANS
ncbi:MAG: hypothetical protein RXR82_00555 [Nitrososphaeria archaeon]